MQIRMEPIVKKDVQALDKLNCNILLVDDESSILDAYKTILAPSKRTSSRRMPSSSASKAKSGYPEYTLFFAESGERAVEICKEQQEKGDPIGVGFFDMLMPGGIDGGETIRQIRSFDPSMMCVIVTAYTDRDPRDIQEYFDDQSMWIYMNKPFNDGEIRQLAANMVHGWNLRKQNKEYSERLEHLVEQRTEQLNAELRKVAIVQKNLLPQKLPSRPGIEIGVYYDTCVELGGGGDYYDVLELPNDKLGLAIADASGHGPSAACIMAITRAMFRSLAIEAEMSPGKVLTELNSRVDGNFPRGHFVTMLYAVLDLKTGLVTYANAGHPFPIFGKTNNFVEHSGKTGMILGMFPVEYEDSELQLESGDHLLLFTDGIEEHRNEKKEQFGYEGILKACDAYGESEPQAFIDGIVKDADAYRPDMPRDDDFTLVDVRWSK